jgi:superfamily II DNA or RNA helicase
MQKHSKETGFQTQLSVEDVNFSELYDALVTDEKRNDFIFDDILKALEKGRSPLVLTERLNHLDALAEKLTGFAKNVIVLKGGMTKKQRTAIFARLQAIPDDEERIILSTGKFIGEGFDDPRLDTLFLLLPISFEGRVEQYAGRLHRGACPACSLSVNRISPGRLHGSMTASMGLPPIFCGAGTEFTLSCFFIA